jgi:CPA1 family monovalent cation:H+ antiporter
LTPRASTPTRGSSSHRLAVAEDHLLSKGAHEGRRLQHYCAPLIAAEAGRKKLLELFNSGRIHDSVMHR